MSREGDGQTDVLLLSPGHVANHRQQTDGMGITGRAEPVDLEPAGKGEPCCRGETPAVWKEGGEFSALPFKVCLFL